MNDESKTPDILEHGAPVDGQPQVSDNRLYMQMQVFTNTANPKAITHAVAQSGLDAVVYLDISDPNGVGVLFFSENPDVFVTEIRDLMTSEHFEDLERRSAMTMFGRTYSLGYEPDLQDAIISRPRRTVLNPEWPWCIWYPLRRNGAFARLDHTEQRQILMEHAHIGRAYGAADFAHDIRLACYGLDEADNDFVIGLLGKELYPLSRVVQDMRKTQQTSLYIDSLGPFFIGKKIWASPNNT